MLQLTDVYAIMSDKFSLVDVGQAGKLHLGVAFDPGAGDRACPWLIIFEPNPKTYEGLSRVDELNFMLTSRETDNKRPFWWDNYDRGKLQTWEGVKSRLEQLGFEPSVVDRFFPKNIDTRNCRNSK